MQELKEGDLVRLSDAASSAIKRGELAVVLGPSRKYKSFYRVKFLSDGTEQGWHRAMLIRPEEQDNDR